MSKIRISAFIFIFFVSCADWGLRKQEWQKRFATYTYTSDIPVPKGAIAYSENLCRVDRIIPVHWFVRARSKFNKFGCVRAMEGWVLDSSLGKWRKLPKDKEILCCDPLKGFRRMSI